MIILGIDPGSRKTGYGIVNAVGNRVTHVENGTLYIEDEPTFAARLVALHRGLTGIIQTFRVESVAIENIFYHKNPRSVQKLGEARGVAILSGACTGLPVHEYSALQVKQAVTGYGKAAKEQMQAMVRKLLNLPDLAEENASDALGVALCHAFNSGKSALAFAGPATASTDPRRELLKKASFYR